MSPTLEKRLLIVLKRASIVFGALIIVILAIQGYRVYWTGFGDYIAPTGEFSRGKTVWDWMGLLVIPLVLLIGAFFLNRSERKVEREIAADRQEEAAFQAYLDRMSDLLLKEDLQTPEGEKILNVARVRTIAVLQALNGKRKRHVLIFLKGLGLLTTDKIFSQNEVDIDLTESYLDYIHLEDISLERANLRKASLRQSILTNANLRNANLTAACLDEAKMLGTQLAGAEFYKARLSNADLRESDLSFASFLEAKLRGSNLACAKLSYASLQRADLRGCDLSDADLSNASVIDANLSGANLKGATFTKTDLSGANLRGAKVTKRQLAEALSLFRTTMPDGSRHD
jgi:uncharacterized protein YjbI with pentapeptide repeats